MRAEIREALQGRPERLLEAQSGDEALRLILREHPRVLVVDVALPGREPFVLCDDITQAGLRTRVILVASVYDHTRYKRRPTSLYGADDYVEQHHIPDMLPGKVERLLGQEHRPWQPTPLDPVVAERLRHAGQALLTIRGGTSEEGLRQAIRLSELLVADLSLYTGDLMTHLGPDEPLPEALRQDLEEARVILAERVPGELLGQRDLVGEAFAQFVARRHEAHRLGERSSSPGAGQGEEGAGGPSGGRP
jgi:DNA-binding NarL/FixJ family response regulator